MNSLTIAKQFLGKEVEVIIDRPFGSSHPEFPDEKYGINAGYIEGVIAPDGEELDAYYLGEDVPLERAIGLCIAVIHRLNDDDDKLVVVPPDKNDIPDDEIEKRINFQEKWYTHEIVRL